MANIQTPLGEILIELDGERIDYMPLESKNTEVLFPNILGRYHVVVDLIQDGKKHVISCMIKSTEELNHTHESGENLECQSFYSEDRIKLSIGLLGECWGYINGRLVYRKNDYDIEYLANGMAYCILEETKTPKYTFGIAWINDVGWDDMPIDGEHDRDVETWFASDPSFPL